MNVEIFEMFKQNEKYFVAVFVLALLTFAMLLIIGFLLADGHDKNVKRIEKLEEELRLEGTRSAYIESFIRRYIDFGVYVRDDEIVGKKREK